jgi:hypothetical protein
VINTKLLQKSQGVKLGPQFYGFASLDASDDYISNYHLLPLWGNTLKISLVGTTCGHKAHHPVIFGNLVFYFVMQIGEGGIEQGHEMFESLAVGGFRVSGKVRQARRAEKFINGGQVLV